MRFPSLFCYTQRSLIGRYLRRCFVVPKNKKKGRSKDEIGLCHQRRPLTASCVWTLNTIAIRERAHPYKGTVKPLSVGQDMKNCLQDTPKPLSSLLKTKQTEYVLEFPKQKPKSFETWKQNYKKCCLLKMSSATTHRSVSRTRSEKK